MKEPTEAEIRAAYEEAKRNFTLEDLRLYEKEEEGVLLADIIRELEEMDRKGDVARSSRQCC